MKNVKRMNLVEKADNYSQFNESTNKGFYKESQEPIVDFFGLDGKIYRISFVPYFNNYSLCKLSSSQVDRTLLNNLEKGWVFYRSLDSFKERILNYKEE